MKKRIISAILALAMIFSVIPTTFATQSIDSSGEITGSPEIITDLKIKIANGKVEYLKFTPGAYQGTAGNSMYAMMFTDHTWYDDGEGFTINDYTEYLSLDDTNGMLVDFMQNTDSADVTFFGMPFMHWTTNGVEGTEVSLSQGDADCINYDWSDSETGFNSETHNTIASDNEIDLEYPEGAHVYIYISPGIGQREDPNNWFIYSFNLDDTRSYTFPEGGDPTPTPEATAAPTYVGDVTVSVTDPVVGAEPSTSSTTSGDNVDTSATTVVWDTTTTPLTLGGKYDASSIYSATVTLTAADGATFQAGSTVTVNSATAVTLTADMISNDGKTATVTYTAPETDLLKVTGVTASGSLTTDTYKPGENFDATGLTATITYNNGESVSGIDPTSNAYGVFAALATDASGASSDSNGAELNLSDNGKYVYLVYDHATDNTSKNSNNTAGVDTTAGVVKSGIADTITVANEALTAAEVTLTYPVPTNLPSSSITPGDATKYSATLDLWSTDEDGNNAVSGNFAYDQDYYVHFTLTPESGYAFDTTNNITVTVHDTASGTDKTVTVPVDQDGNVYATVKFDASPSTDVTFTSATAYDEYNGGKDVTITLDLGTHVTGDIKGLTIGGQSITGYTVNANGTITVPKASLAGKFTGLTATAVSKDIEIDVNQVNTPVTGTIDMSDTTPYITITQPSNGGTISSSPSIGTGRVALTKGTAYTLTFTGAPAHTTGYTWTVNGITGTDNGSTYTFTPAGGEDITVTAEATVADSYTLTVNISGNGTVTVNGDSVANGDTYTIYDDTDYTLAATVADAYTKFTGWTGDVTDANATTNILKTDVTGNKTVTANFTDKTAATLNIAEKHFYQDNPADLVYDGYSVGDYSAPTIKIDSTTLTSGTDYTIADGKITILSTSPVLTGASAGNHTITFDFGEASPKSGTIVVHAPRSIGNVTLPTTSFKHGDYFDATGLAFTITTDGTPVTYTYDGTNWSTALPSDIQIKLGNGSFMAPDTFISTYEAKITRYDTDVTGTVNNGDKITVSAGSINASSATGISVGQKPITIDASTTDADGFDKVYDGTSNVTASPINWALASGYTWVGDDANTITINVSGKYYQDGTFAVEAKDASTNALGYPIKFTAAPSGNDAGNYIISVSNGSGNITKAPLVITDITNVPNAIQNVPKSGTGATATVGTTATTSSAIYDNNIVVTFDYSYDSVATATNGQRTQDVTITNASINNNNYNPTYPSKVKGIVDERSITDIEIINANKTYYYSDKLAATDIQVKLTYADGGDATFDLDNIPTEVTVTWPDDSAVNTTTELTVPDHSGKTITATSGSLTDTTSVTVKPIPVIVTASGTINKVYDGNTTYTGNDVTYTNALDADKLADNGTYSAKVAALGASTATVAFGGKDATNTATAADVTNPVLTDKDNFTATIKNEVTYTIDKRPITVSAIKVPSVLQGSTGTGSVPSATIPDITFAGVSGNTDSGVVGSEQPTVTYSYEYDSTVAAVDTTSDITISGLALVTGDTTNANYTLETSNPTPNGEVKARTVSDNGITVTAPTQFGTAQPYGTALDLAGLKVQISYEDGSAETYIWKNSTTWTLQVQDEDDVDVTTVPFTLTWETLGTQPTQGETLTVADHNGKGIVATSTITPGESGKSSPVTVNPIEITAITATLSSGAIEKEYDGKKDLEAADAALITYTYTGVETGDTVAISTTPSYASKDAADSITINFTAPTLTNDCNGKYKLANNLTVTSSLTGKITQKPVTITGAYVPPTYVDATAAADEPHDVTATLGTDATVADKVTATGFINAEGDAMTFTYTATYTAASLHTAGNPDVAITNGAVTGTNSGNYSYTWTSPQKGTVLADAFTDATITAPTDMEYTHGDVFDPTGMSVTIKTSSDPTGTTYTVTGAAGSYAWNTALPTGVSVAINGISLTSNNDLNRNAHYTNMNGKAITVTAGTESDSTGNVTVAKADLTVTPSASTWDKTYDGDDVVDGVTYTVSGLKTINGTPDVVTVTSVDAKYADKNVSKDGSDNVIAKTITFSNIALSTGDSANYNAPTIADGSGKINPFALEVTAINDTIPEATWNEPTTGTDTKTTTNYTTSATAPDSGLTIEYTYTYDSVAAVGPVTAGVTISDVDLSPANTNYTVTYTGGKKDGNVVTAGIDSLAIKTQPTLTYKYGDTLDISGMVVTVTYTGGSTVDVTYNDSTWTTLGLKIDDSSLDNGDSLKTANTGDKVKVTTSSGDKSAETDALTVNKRKLNITGTPSATVTKTYDGTTDVEQTITLAIEAAQGSFDGLLAGDTCTLSNTTPSFVYNDKNVADGIGLTLGETVTLTGTNAGEYELTFPTTLTGAITKREVTVTPVIDDIPVDKFATTDKVIKETGVSAPAKVTLSELVDGEGTDFTFNYTVTVPAADLKVVDTYSYAPTGTSETGTGIGNYEFTWNNAIVNVVVNDAASAEITKAPDKLTYVYGDTLDLTGMEVTVTYASGDKEPFEYGTQKWNDEGLTALLDNAAVPTILTVANNNKDDITVTVPTSTGTITTSDSEEITVGKRDLTLTAAANGTITKVYDSTNTVDSSQVTVTDSGKYSDDVVTIGTVTATYDDKNVDTGKTVTVTVSGTTIKNAAGTDVTSEYNIINPTNTLTGAITVKDIIITVPSTTVIELLVGSTPTNNEPVSPYTQSAAIYSGDDVTFTVTADCTSVDTSAERTVTVPVTSPIVATGTDAGNYNITCVDDVTVKVVSNIITNIGVTGGKATYTHGDALDLTGMVITVSYLNNVDDNVFTYAGNDMWTPTNSYKGSTADVSTSALPVSIAINNVAVTDVTMQLRHDTHNTKNLVVSGGQATPVNALTLTVNQKEIDDIAIAYATGKTSEDIKKTYDGNTTVETADQENIVYTTTDIVSFNGTPDTVTVTGVATYADANASDSDKALTFGSYAISGTDAGNYKLATAPTVTGDSNVKGKISKATLTITITSVPSIFINGAKDIELTKGTDYTQTGEVNGETVDVKVTGTYAQNTPVGTSDVTYEVAQTEKDKYPNYNIQLSGDPDGEVKAKAVTSIVITTPPTTDTYEHGDNLDLDGMVITVTYDGDPNDPADDETKVYTYDTTTDQWNVDGTSVATPADVVIEWKGTATTVDVDGQLRLDDTDKNLVIDDDDKKGTIEVAPADTSSTAQPAETDITITKKELTLEVSGTLTKVYDGTTNITAETTGTLTFTLDGVVDNDGVSVDETTTKGNIKFSQSDAMDPVPPTPPALVVEETDVVLTDNSNMAQYYSGPSIINQTGNIITKKPLVFKTIVNGPVVEVDAPATGTMDPIGKAGYTTDPVDGLVGNEDIKIIVDYTFIDGTSEENDNAPVSYNNGQIHEDSTEVAKNYDWSFALENGTGKVVGVGVTGIEIKTPDKTAGYTHGDEIDLTGTEITVTYENGKTDKYVYDPSSEKWTYIKDGTEQPDKAELPSEIVLGFTDGETITPDTIVKYPNDGKTITVTYTKDTTTLTDATEEAFDIDQKEVTIVVGVLSTDSPIVQEYSSESAVNAENLAKLSIDKSQVVAIDGETITVVDGTLAADFASEDVAYDADKNVIAQEITVKADSFSLGGDDAGNYKLVVFNNVTGKITPKTATVTANSVPSIKEEETNLVVDITDYTTDGIITGDDITITWQGTYDKTTATVDTTTKREVGGTDAGNYTVTFTPDSQQGNVTLKVVTGVTIDNQPKYAGESPMHGDTVGADGLDNLEYTVEYSDGSETKHKKENGEWVTTDGYTEPEEGTKFTWNGTTEDVTENSIIRKDKDNTVTIAVEGKTATTDVVAAAVKPVTIKAVGTYTKVYDGTNTITLNETTPEITYVIEGLAEGDVITVTATPSFADENVAKFGDIYQKAINFADVKVTGDEAVLANYEIQKDENGNEISPIVGAITPKTMNITAISVPSKTKGGSLDVTKSKSKDFTTTDIIEKDKDTVTISYKGTYSSTSTTGENIPVTIDASSVVIDGDEKAILNYIVGTVTGATGKVTTGGGGGGGGGGNSLTIKYELEDGKAGATVTSITAPADSEPVDLIAVFTTKPKDPTVIWTSDDENIVKVDENGIVSFIAEGKATITAVSKTNKSLSDKVTVTVTKSLATPTPVPTEKPDDGPTIIHDPLFSKDMLNPYIVGYGDNVFGPELPISREEVATIFARLIANDLYMDKEYIPSFPDVEPEGWSRDYIGYLEGFDVVTGYDDGTFQPKAYITRAEMAVMMARAQGYEISGYLDGNETGFPDIPEGYNSWATKAIKYLTEAGIMYGYEDGTFRPEQPITRAETVATVNRVLTSQKVDKIEVIPSDVTNDHWAYDDIVFAMNHRILKDVSADASVFIDSEEFDKNMETVVVDKDGNEVETTDGETSPSESPAPTALPEATPAATPAATEEAKK